MVRKSCLLVLLFFAWTLGVAQHAAAGPQLDADQIKAVLRTAAPEEDGFVDRIVTLSNKGLLPASLVDTTFQWARKKPRHKFQFFKRALIVRAEEAGIHLE